MGRYVTHGCRSGGACRYSTLPSDMGTPYLRCPVCGGPWGEVPPRVPTLENAPKPAMLSASNRRAVHKASMMPTPRTPRVPDVGEQFGLAFGRKR